MSPDSILHWLLRTTLEGSALIVAVLAIRRLMGNLMTPAWRVALWSMVALKLLVPASLPTVGIGSFWFTASSDRVTIKEGRRGLQSTSASDHMMLSHSDEGTASTATGSGVATRHALSPDLDRGLKPTAIVLDRYAIMLGIWMLGVLVILGVAVVRDMRFRRKLARLPLNRDRQLTARVDDVAHALRLTRAPRILITEASTVPSVTGLLSPVLLMPRDWESQFDADELDSILRHELLHLKHHDLWLNWFAALVNALHWFNPLVWLAVARCQEDRELRCDERALSIASSEQRIAYGRTLLRLAERFITPPAIAGVAPCVRTHPLLRQRILMITHPSSHRPWLHALCSLALGALVIVSFGSARAQEEKPGRTREGQRTSPEADAPRRGGEENGAARKGEADGMKKRGDGDGALTSMPGVLSDPASVPNTDSIVTYNAKLKFISPDEAAKAISQVITLSQSGRLAPMQRGNQLLITERGSTVRSMIALLAELDQPDKQAEGTKKPAEGEGGRRIGLRDGEGTKRPAEGDGARRTGPRDGEGTRKPGMRDGEGGKKSAEGDGARKTGPRDGEGSRKSAEGEGTRRSFEGEGSRKVGARDGDAPATGNTLVLRVIDGGETIVINGEKIPHSRLRGHLSEFLPEHRGDQVTIEADDDVPFKSVADVLDAARDNGAKGAKITSGGKGDR